MVAVRVRCWKGVPWVGWQCSVMRAAGSAVVAGMLVVGCGRQTEQPAASEDRASSASSTLSESPIEAPLDSADIQMIARRAAARAGEDDPRAVEWVYATRQAAVRLVSDSFLADAEGDALLIQMQGSFTLKDAHQEPGSDAGPPSGTALALVIDVDTGRTTDRAVLREPRDLHALGEVHSS